MACPSIPTANLPMKKPSSSASGCATSVTWARDEFSKAIDLSLDAISRATGVTARGHRAPYFSIDHRTPWALDVLRERGLRYDSSFHPTRNMLYGYPDAKREPHLADKDSRFVE